MARRSRRAGGSHRHNRPHPRPIALSPVAVRDGHVRLAGWVYGAAPHEGLLLCPAAAADLGAALLEAATYAQTSLVWDDSDPAHASGSGPETRGTRAARPPRNRPTRPVDSGL